MTETQKKFIKAYKRHQKKVPDVPAIAKDLGYGIRSVQQLIYKYRKEGLIK